MISKSVSYLTDQPSTGQQSHEKYHHYHDTPH